MINQLSQRAPRVLHHQTIILHNPTVPYPSEFPYRYEHIVHLPSSSSHTVWNVGPLPASTHVFTAIIPVCSQNSLSNFPFLFLKLLQHPLVFQAPTGICICFETVTTFSILLPQTFKCFKTRELWFERSASVSKPLNKSVTNLLHHLAMTTQYQIHLFP